MRATTLANCGTRMVNLENLTTAQISANVVAFLA